MTAPFIAVDRLRREFSVAETRAGAWGAVAGLFSRTRRIKTAVDDVSFSIGAGEFVGYVGENGAGKSTTIKILTGILVPTSGTAVVGGLVPWERRREHAAQIGVVFGQRSQLWWDLPVRESFDLLRSIFRIPDDRYAASRAELIDALELGALLDVPVRKLSLGQRMRCDLAAALLHEPKILFLDEPTIGLDLIAKDQVRAFLKKVNAERGTTIILTTHDMDDIEALCSRIMILDEGRLVFDGPTAQLKRRYATDTLLVVELHDGSPEPSIPGVAETFREGPVRHLTFNPETHPIQEVIGSLFAAACVKDIAIHDSKVADVVKAIYAEGNHRP